MERKLVECGTQKSEFECSWEPSIPTKRGPNGQDLLNTASVNQDFLKYMRGSLKRL